jgi:hypothetical protein
MYGFFRGVVHLSFGDHIVAQRANAVLSVICIPVLRKLILWPAWEYGDMSNVGGL